MASLRREGKIVRDVPRDFVLRAGDVVALASRRAGMVAAGTQIGQELDDADLLAVPIIQASIVVIRPDVVNRTLAELGLKAGRGLFLNGVTRGQTDLPRIMGVRIQRGDVFHLSGSLQAIAAAAAAAMSSRSVSPCPSR